MVTLVYRFDTEIRIYQYAEDANDRKIDTSLMDRKRGILTPELEVQLLSRTLIPQSKQHQYHAAGLRYSGRGSRIGYVQEPRQFELPAPA